MNGAEALIHTAAAAGVTVCFANPGTTEMPLVAAFDAVPGMRAVLGLFEGVCTGAADGYARMADKPALTLLHLGPGLGNGIANLHNARRAHTPVVNIIGEHATWHMANDPPLHMAIERLASTVSGWVRTTQTAADAAQDMADAIFAAQTGQVATLIAPNDVQLGETSAVVPPVAPRGAAAVDGAAIEAAARLLRSGVKCALILGGNALRRPALHLAARIRAATGCDLLAEGYAARVECGADVPAAARILYFPEQALAQLAPYQAFVLVNAPEPVAFFGYPNTPGRFIREQQQIVSVGGRGQDGAALLEALAEAVGAPRQVTITSPPRPQLPAGPLNGDVVGATLAACQPEHAIVVNEGVTTGRTYMPLAAGAPPHTLLTITGGSIGFGIPAATGAAIACPDRPVIDLQADGSAMYTLQALWTQAREQLNVTTLICSNRRYQILIGELMRAGVKEPVGAMRSLVDLGHPDLDWVQLGRGMGVPSVAVDTAEELAAAIGRALAEPGPHLIEMRMV